MARKRTFWMGALWGAGVACIAERLVQRRLAARRRLAVVSGGRSASVVQLPAGDVPLKREQGAGDPAELLAHRGGTSRPVFERRGGAPGPARSGEASETPGRPGEQIDHGNTSQPLRSASRTPGIPPAHES